MKFYKILGILIMLSGCFVVIPQLLNFIVFLTTRGWMVDIDIFDTLTHYGGILNGSLAIPTYKEYYELGFLGFGFIIAAALSVKFGSDLIKLKPNAPIKIAFVELAIILLFIALLFKFGFYIELIVWGILPPAIIGILCIVARRYLSLQQAQ